MTALDETSLSADERALIERFSMLDDAASELGLDALTWAFSVHVHTPAWLAQRREIRSFFIAEVDRDKVVLGC
jgi:hypothetical protein